MKDGVVWKILAKLSENMDKLYKTVKDKPQDSVEYQEYVNQYKVYVIQCNILLEVILGDNSKLLSHGVEKCTTLVKDRVVHPVGTNVLYKGVESVVVGVTWDSYMNYFHHLDNGIIVSDATLLEIR